MEGKREWIPRKIRSRSLNLELKTEKMLHKIKISNFENAAGSVQDHTVSFQLFGPELGTAPIVLVNHALTGNSQVTGENGWWNAIVGPGKAINTDSYTVLCINIPGNGFDGEEAHLLHNYKEFTLGDIARLFLSVLDKLDIADLFAIVGGSIGGALAWEIAVLRPHLTEHVVPIATDLKATDWVIANCKVQDQILNNSATPVSDARMHAMTFYRTPQSFSQKFNRDKEDDSTCYKVENWLQYHGRQLEDRYKLASYKLLNHLLTTIDIGRDSGDYLESALKIHAKIHLISVNTDWFFLAKENWDTYVHLSLNKKDVTISEIKSIHGHDAFLMEKAQLSRFLTPIFSFKKAKLEAYQSSAV